MKHGLVLLSDQDLDAPVLPAVATVSKDDPRDDGAFSIGEGDAQTQESLWVDRPYFTGNPSVAWMADKALRVIRAGGYCQVGNELNHPIENWRGGVNAYYDLFNATRFALIDAGGDPPRLLWMPPSPGFEGWQRWVLPAAPGYAVHCYGPRQVMQATVQWYLDNTAGDLFVTECNPGAGNVFDLTAWSRDHLRPFLDWCSAQPRVRMVAYFAWRWNESARLPSSVDAAGTEVERLLRAWTPPQEAPMVTTTKGIDISNNNGVVSLTQVKAAGYQFVAIKASQDTPSGGFRDAYFASNWRVAGELGLARIAYHMTDARYASPEQSVGLVQEMVDGVGGLGAGDAVALDAELGPMPQKWFAEALDLASRVFFHLVWKYSGDWYTSQEGIENPAFERNPTWFVGAPGDAEQPGWRPVKMWQTTLPAGAVPGVAGACDVNTFMGTIAELRALGKPAAAVPPEVMAALTTLWDYAGPNVATQKAIVAVKVALGLQEAA